MRGSHRANLIWKLSIYTHFEEFFTFYLSMRVFHVIGKEQQFCLCTFIQHLNHFYVGRKWRLLTINFYILIVYIYYLAHLALREPGQSANIRDCKPINFADITVKPR